MRVCMHHNNHNAVCTYLHFAWAHAVVLEQHQRQLGPQARVGDGRVGGQPWVVHVVHRSAHIAPHLAHHQVRAAVHFFPVQRDQVVRGVLVQPLAARHHKFVGLLEEHLEERMLAGQLSALLPHHIALHLLGPAPDRPAQPCARPGQVFRLLPLQRPVGRLPYMCVRGVGEMLGGGACE